MRAGIGLIGLLMGVALIFYLMSGDVAVTRDAQQQMEEQTNSFSGKDKEGNVATDSITFAAGPKGVLVQAVTPGGAFDQHFGLLPGDIILEIGPLLTKEQARDDATAKAFLHDAYARNEKLLVQRGSQKIKLPDERQPVNPPGINPPGANPAVPTMANPQSQQRTPAAPTDTTPPQRPVNNATGAAHDLIDKIQSH